MEYVTKYQKTVSVDEGKENKILVDKMNGVEELHFNRERFNKIRKILFDEGFTT